jgi:hypothetical protein
MPLRGSGRAPYAGLPGAGRVYTPPFRPGPAPLRSPFRCHVLGLVRKPTAGTARRFRGFCRQHLSRRAVRSAACARAPAGHYAGSLCRCTCQPLTRPPCTRGGAARPPYPRGGHRPPVLALRAIEPVCSEALPPNLRCSPAQGLGVVAQNLSSSRPFSKTAYARVPRSIHILTPTPPPTP